MFYNIAAVAETRSLAIFRGFVVLDVMCHQMSMLGALGTTLKTKTHSVSVLLSATQWRQSAVPKWWSLLFHQGKARTEVLCHSGCDAQSLFTKQHCSTHTCKV